MKHITINKDACLLLGIWIGVVFMSIIFECTSNDDKHPYKEDTTKIDSLTKVNDSIKIKIEKLDSVKDAKVIEVSTLDNDSTLKLFYKLVKE